MVGGRLYMSTNLGQSAAIDPATGETLWVTARWTTAPAGRAAARRAASATGTTPGWTTSASSS